MPHPLPGCRPQKQTLPSHSAGLGDPVFTRVPVPSNWPITALTKSFICLKSLWLMLPEPSMRKTMSISWCGHSAEGERRIRDARVGTSHLRGPRKPPPPQMQGGVLGVGINSHPVSTPSTEETPPVTSAPSPLSRVPVTPFFPQGPKRGRRK